MPQLHTFIFLRHIKWRRSLSQKIMISNQTLSQFFGKLIPIRHSPKWRRDLRSDTDSLFPSCKAIPEDTTYEKVFGNCVVLGNCLVRSKSIAPFPSWLPLALWANHTTEFSHAIKLNSSFNLIFPENSTLDSLNKPELLKISFVTNSVSAYLLCAVWIYWHIRGKSSKISVFKHFVS